MTPTLSIIVPAYNAEKYINACVNSILASTFHNFELILINDGSTDCTPILCDELALRDNRIHVIHTENRGVSMARNLGIENAAGEYIGFVDADDLVSPDMFYTLVSSMKPDVSLSACLFQQNTRAYMLFETPTHTCAVIYDQVESAKAIIQGRYGPYLFNKLYRKSILNSHDIRFRPGNHVAEDLLFNADYLRHCKSAAFTPHKLYGYVITEGSVMHTFRTRNTVSQRYTSLPRSWRMTTEAMKDISFDLELWSRAKTAMFYQTVLRKLSKPDKAFIMEAISYVRKNKYTLLHFSWGTKYYLSALVLSISYSFWASVFRRGIS